MRVVRKIVNSLIYKWRRTFDRTYNVKDEKFKELGQNVQIMTENSLHHKDNISIGNNVYIGGDAYIWGIGGIRIGDNTILGPRVTIHTSNHRYEDADFLPFDNYTYLEEVIIGRNVWIGDSAMICPGVKIGDGAVVAMGSVVSQDVPDLAVVAGNPAKIVKTRNRQRYEELDVNEKYYLYEKANNGNFERHYIKK